MQLRIGRDVALLAAVLAAPAAGVDLREAVALHQAGRLDEALAAYREIASNATSGDDRSAARNNACVLLHDRGDFVSALPECAAAVRLRQASGAERELAQSLNNWALALQASGDRDEARLRLGEALALNGRLGEREEEVVNLGNLAAFEIENGRYGDALDRLAAAERRVDGAAGAAWTAEQGRVLRLNRAVVLERLGAWRESLALLSALAAEPEPDPAHAATLVVDLAVAYRNLGDPRTAERLLERAIDQLETLDDRAALGNALLNLGLAAELNLRDSARARDAYGKALELARAGGDPIGQVQALVGLARVALAVDDVARAAGHAAEAVSLSATIDDPEARWSALDAEARVARAEGRTSDALERFLAAIEAVERVREGSGPATVRAGFLTDKRGLFGAAVDLAAGEAVRGGRDAILSALAIVQRAKARELLDAAGVGSRPLDAAGLAALAEGERQVIELFVGESRLWRFELGSGAVRLMDLGPAPELLELAAEAHAELARGAASPALDRLGPRLLDGLAVEGGELAIAFDGRLRYLPFDALRLGDGSLLIDRAVLFALPSASFLSAARRQAAGGSHSYVGFAPASGALDPRSRAGLLAARFSLAPLPASAAEVAAVAELLPGRAVALIGGNATIPALREAVAEGVRLLHLAAHTVLDERLAGEGAAVFLAPAGPEDDGLLSPRTIAALPLDGTLVLLSGCSTALGSTRDGEALSTLAGSFLAAGASGVIASLWEVGDRASAELMEQLAFELARGARPAAALRSAKLRLAGVPGGERPSVWAAFVLIGDAEAPYPESSRDSMALLLAALATGGALAAAAVALRRYRSYRRAGSIISSSGSERATRAPDASNAETSRR